MSLSLPSYLEKQALLYRLDKARELSAAQIRPLDWIESNFYIPETIAPIQLMPYQRAVLKEAYRTDADGNYAYSVVVWSDIKKSAKSSIAAAVALERARRIAWGSVKVVANDLKQADSRVAFYARRAIELATKAQRPFTTGLQMKPSGYQITFPNRAMIEAIPVDPKGEAGGNDDLIIFSELWAANQKAALRMWTEMTLSPTKYGKSQRWIETYAGFSGESPLLEQLYQVGVKEGRQLDLGIPGLEVYTNDASKLLCLWNTQPRCPWQTAEYYAQESAVLAPNEFQRVHRNQWVSSEDVFVPGEWWDTCLTDVPPLGEYQSIVIGIDAATTSDCFGIVAVSKESPNTVAVRYARAWTPPQGGKIDFDEPEAELRRLAQQYKVAQFAFDPYQLHDLATRLRKQGVGWFKEFKQGEDRLIADKQLHDMIRERRVLHSAEPELTAHIKHANRKTEGEKMRIIKRAEHLKIDLAVALSMATHEAMRLNI